MKRTFEPALWDHSDPSYAPCLKWGGRDRKHAYWVAPQRYVKAGYAVKRIKIGGGNPDDPVPHPWAARCRELTREMVGWYEDMGAKVEPGTWHWLIGRYRSDDISPFQSTKANTRDSYLYWLNAIDAVMGKVRIEQTTYEVLMQIRRGKEAKGRSVHHVHSWFSALRRVARYGVLIGAKDASRVAEILANMRLPTPAARQTAATRDQIEAIVAEADRRGMRSFAAGVLIQWWFGLRAVDVRGQYLDKVWVDGLTWGMFDADIKGFEKVISKTAKSLPEAYRFDITVVPGLRKRLLEMRAELHPRYHAPDMPIALNRRTGKAYTPSGWTQAWSDCRKASGVAVGVWCMDTRAGAITDASQIPGVSMSQLRNAAQHKDASTTGRYIRDRSSDANRVVELRAAASNPKH